MELIVNLSVISVFIGLWMYARYWRRMCGKAFCQYAAACCGREEREKLMRYAIIAGNRHAPLLYALTYPERFDKARPLRLFEFRGIRCVFAGYYFPQRYENWLCDDQSEFVRKVYDFKEGERPVPELFLAGVPGSFRYRRCDRHVYAMQHFPALPSTFFRYSRFSGVRGLCPVGAGSDMYHGRQGEQTYFRKTFRSGYGQLYDGEGAAGKTGRNRG